MNLQQMESPKSPTNKDIIRMLVSMQLENEAQHEEVTKRLGGVEEQVKYTNGRVRALETRALQDDAVEAYKQNQAQAMPMQAIKVETNNAWDWKTVLTILLTLATIIAGVVGVTGGVGK